MSRGFDNFEIDDFRDFLSESRNSSSDRNTSHGRGGSSQTGPGAQEKLDRLRDAEFRSDELFREHGKPNPSSSSRQARQAEILAVQDRREIPGRDRAYSLRPSEIHTLAEVGTFRVVAVGDLLSHAYAGDRSRLDSDLRNLIRQGLVERRETTALKKESQKVLTLTKRGERLIRRQGFVTDSQAIYEGFVKPKEATHDAALYRLYQKAADEIDRKGGKVVRVQLDYELKEELYRKLGRAQARGEGQMQQTKQAFATQLQLPVVHGKVSFPDLRIEYSTSQMEMARVDLELATGHYHARHLAEKARAGFQIYAQAEDVSGLRRIRDDREIMTSILSL